MGAVRYSELRLQGTRTPSERPPIEGPPEGVPLTIPGENDATWQLPDALEWLRRKGFITDERTLPFKEEGNFWLFCEKWEEGWEGTGLIPERIVAGDEALGIWIVYREYPTRDVGTGETSGGRCLLRCFKFRRFREKRGRPVGSLDKYRTPGVRRGRPPNREQQGGRWSAWAP